MGNKSSRTEEEIIQEDKDFVEKLKKSGVRIRPFTGDDRWEHQALMNIVKSTYFKQVEFINPHQVMWDHYGTYEEMEFHNNGLAPEDFITSPYYYAGNYYGV